MDKKLKISENFNKTQIATSNCKRTNLSEYSYRKAIRSDKDNKNLNNVSRSSTEADHSFYTKTLAKINIINLKNINSNTSTKINKNKISLKNLNSNSLSKINKNIYYTNFNIFNSLATRFSKINLSSFYIYSYFNNHYTNFYNFSIVGKITNFNYSIFKDNTSNKNNNFFKNYKCYNFSYKTNYKYNSFYFNKDNSYNNYIKDTTHFNRFLANVYSYKGISYSSFNKNKPIYNTCIFNIDWFFDTNFHSYLFINNEYYNRRDFKKKQKNV